MAIIFNLTILCLGALFYFWRIPYANELIISFFPYAIPFLLIGLIYHLYHLWKQLYKKTKFRFPPVLLVLGFGALFLLYSQEFTGFYNRKILTEETLPSSLRVFFANIHKDNTNYSAIKEIINQEEPDIILLIEFDNHHKQHLKEFLQESYPYMSENSWSRRFVGDIVFSKYPLSIPSSGQKNNEDTRKYKYFSLDKEGTPYFFYLVHTSSPVSKRYFLKRNKQFTKITKDIEEKNKQTKITKSVILGDLNVAPWSFYYKDFAKSLPDFQNITQALPFTFTWNMADMFSIGDTFPHRPTWMTKTLSKLHIFRTHIDHALVSKDTKVKGIKRIHVPGSDHRGFVFDIE